MIIPSSTGTTFATALPIPPSGRVVSWKVMTVPAGSGVKLPGAVDTTVQLMFTNDGTNALLIYPNAGGTIDESPSPYSLAAGASATFWAITPLDWATTAGGAAGGPPAAASRPFTAILGQGAAIAVGTNSAGNYLVCSAAGTFSRWDMICPVANQPAGSALVVDVLKSSNRGSTWASLWPTTPANRPTIPAGSNFGGGAAFDTAAYAAGDWLRFDVITAGGGGVQNVTLVVS